jgi:hypothetical protein
MSRQHRTASNLRIKEREAYSLPWVCLLANVSRHDWQPLTESLAEGLTIDDIANLTPKFWDSHRDSMILPRTLASIV